MDTVRSADGTTIAFDRTGDGPPLIIVGGALSDRAAAAPLAEILSGDFTVVAYDRRGRGNSSDTPPYAVEREVEDLAALLDAVGGSGSVLGHSSGAALAIEAVVRGLPITRLAAYEPPFIVDDSRPALPAGYDEHLDELLAEGRRGDAVAYFMTAGVGLPTAMVDQMRGAPMWPAMEALAHTIPSATARRVGERRHDPHARDGRRQQPRMGTERGIGRRGGDPRRRATHARRPGPRGGARGAGSRLEIVLRGLRHHRVA